MQGVITKLRVILAKYKLTKKGLAIDKKKKIKKKIYIT